MWREAGRVFLRTDRAWLFTPRGDAPRGHGLGLIFCRMAARATGGAIAYELPASGRGATFRVTLPLAPAVKPG